MNTIHEIIGITAGILAISGYIPYIISILRGKTKPDRATWLIWTIVGGILAFSYIATGDMKAIWLPLGYFLGPFITMLLSIRYGYSRWSKLDTVCVVIASVSLLPWLIAKDPIITLLINVFIDATGAIPTIVKTYKEPETEDFTAWIIFFTANTLELFAITEWSLSEIYPIYLFVLAGTMVSLILLGKITKKNQAHNTLGSQTQDTPVKKKDKIDA